MPLVISELASEMGLVPLVWLGAMHVMGKRPGVAWWWLAGAFAVSWVADTAAIWVHPFLIGSVYPVTQAAIVAAVFLTRPDAMKLVVVLVIVGIADVLWNGVSGPDVLLRTAAWLSVVGVIYQLPQLGLLRTSLLVTFGLGWLIWMGYCVWPGWTSWLLYQATRLIGTVFFCVAATNPTPHFRVIRNRPISGMK